MAATTAARSAYLLLKKGLSASFFAPLICPCALASAVASSLICSDFVIASPLDRSGRGNRCTRSNSTQASRGHGHAGRVRRCSARGHQSGQQPSIVLSHPRQPPRGHVPVGIAEGADFIPALHGIPRGLRDRGDAHVFAALTALAHGLLPSFANKFTRSKNASLHSWQMPCESGPAVPSSGTRMRSPSCTLRPLTPRQPPQTVTITPLVLADTTSPAAAPRSAARRGAWPPPDASAARCGPTCPSRPCGASPA